MIKYNLMKQGFSFEIKDKEKEMLKMLAKSHPRIFKVIRGALCKKFVEELGYFLSKKITLEEAYELCQRTK